MWNQLKRIEMQFLCLKRFPFLVCFSISLPLLGCIARASINQPENTTIPAVIFFGDSLVDTGNNNYIDTTVKTNYPPYGKDFEGGKPTGRFSNGKVPPDLLVEELGIKPLLPAYLDPSLQDEDLLTGVNFASAAAGYDPLTSDNQSVFSLTDQLEMFKNYTTKLKKIAGDKRSSEILRGKFNCSVQLQYDVASYTELLVSYASSFVQDLYRLGTRRIGVFGLPAIGCLPSQRTLKGGLGRKCVDEYNRIAQSFNEKLSAELISLNKQSPEARLLSSDRESIQTYRTPVSQPIPQQLHLRKIILQI
ncbi:hypothetical protein DH2020_005167 [Rehmannia glutinosa]|uniref:GDSL esterase/lipase n=1 Tax=Rehmannia glutinosa TaxID=99300 RepID=A0ABR0XRJ5_REHGL